MTTWAEVEPTIRDRAYRRIDAMPEILLETDSWFTLDADLFYARLIGYDDEIVQDGVLLPKVEHDIFVGINQPLDYELLADDAFLHKAGIATLDTAIPTLRTARYALQSCFVTLSVSGELYDPPVKKLRDDFTARIAYLRYRRRS